MMNADVVPFVFIHIHKACLTDCPAEPDTKKATAPFHAVIWFERPAQGSKNPAHGGTRIPVGWKNHRIPDNRKSIFVNRVDVKGYKCHRLSESEGIYP